MAGEDVIKKLKKNPKLWAFLDSTFEFTDIAGGVRLVSHWGHMGGARIAPYHVRVKAEEDPATQFTLTVVCEQHFIDAKGNEIPLENGEISSDIIAKTVKVGEKPTSVSLKLLTGCSTTD